MKSAILAAVLSAWTGLGVPADATRAKAFIGARVFDGAGNVIERATIVVRDGRIQQVGPADRIQVPAGAEGICTHARSPAETAHRANRGARRGVTPGHVRPKASPNDMGVRLK
jgi:hypothetical protein